MANHIHLSLQAAVTTVEQVLKPALRSDNPLAVEQVEVLAQLLIFLDQRVDQLTPAARAALTQNIELGRRVASLAAPDLNVVALRDALSKAELVLADGWASLEDLDRAERAVTAGISCAVRQAAGASDLVRSSLDETVVAASLEQLALARAWVLPQGWEPNPNAVDDLDTVLRRLAPTSAQKGNTP